MGQDRLRDQPRRQPRGLFDGCERRDQQDLTQDPDEDGEPEWAPDGSRIAFHTNRDGNFEIYSMNPDGGDPQRLTDSPGIDLSAAWSPDGARIAFSSNRSGHFQLHVLDLALMQTTQLTDGGLRCQLS